MPRPDEGLIHAWLDGQLPPAEAARVESLAASDPEWAAAVAEARGLTAASSRIVSMLDHVPADVVPPRSTTTALPRRMPWWMKVAATMVLMAGGGWLVLRQSPESTVPATAEPSSAAVPVAPSPLADASAPAKARTAPIPSAPKSVGVTKRKTGDETRTPRMATLPAPAASMAGAAPAEDRAAQKAEARPTTEREVAAVLEAKTVQAPSIAKPSDSSTAKNAARELDVAARSQRQRVTLSAAGNRCFRLMPDSTEKDNAVVMRVVRVDGDTLRLEPTQDSTGWRAWIVWRDQAGHGVLSTGDVRRSNVRVTAASTPCPLR
jgi:anti-sigma factor RsiW